MVLRDLVWINMPYPALSGTKSYLCSQYEEIKTIGRGYGTAERYRIAILFFYGGLDTC